LASQCTPRCAGEQWLEKAVEDSYGMDELNYLPLWKDLRSNSRVQALLRKMHFIK
jgi:hypothetical protein